MSSLRVAARALLVAVAGLCLSTVSAYSSQCKGGALQTLLRFSAEGAPIKVTSLSTAEDPEGMLSGLSRWKKAVYVDPVGFDASKFSGTVVASKPCGTARENVDLVWAPLTDVEPSEEELDNGLARAAIPDPANPLPLVHAKESRGSHLKSLTFSDCENNALGSLSVVPGPDAEELESVLLPFLVKAPTAATHAFHVLMLENAEGKEVGMLWTRDGGDALDSETDSGFLGQTEFDVFLYPSEEAVSSAAAPGEPIHVFRGHQLPQSRVFLIESVNSMAVTATVSEDTMRLAFDATLTFAVNNVFAASGFDLCTATAWFGGVLFVTAITAVIITCALTVFVSSKMKAMQERKAQKLK